MGPDCKGWVGIQESEYLVPIRSICRTAGVGLGFRSVSILFLFVLIYGAGLQGVGWDSGE